MSIPSLHIVGGRKLGGAERFYVRLVNALHARGEAVSAMTVAGGEIDAALAPGVPRLHAPLAGVWDLWSRWRVTQAVRQFAPAMVQTYMGRATRLTHLPRDGKAVHIARLGGYYNLKGYRHAHAWVGNTRGIRDYLIREGLPEDRVFYIGNFVDTPPRHGKEELDALRRELGVPEEAMVVLGLGRLHANKGFADLLGAFARMPAELHGRPVWLVMVGDGPLRESLQAAAAQMGISGRIAWAGWRYDPAPWYQLADVFVCSSVHEPLGNVILEAWANGVPVVSTRAQGPEELIEHERDGLLSPVGDPAWLAISILHVLGMPEAERQLLVSAGAAKLAASFSEEAIVSAYLAMYRRLAF